MEAPLPPEPRADLPRRCPSCGEATRYPSHCGACGALLAEPPGTTHFERLGMERRYGLDAKGLSERFLEASRALHPDRFAGRGEEDRATSLVAQSALNDAYATLRDPMRRAEYLLKLEGGVGPEKDKRTWPGFLEEMLALREEMAEGGLPAEAERGLEERLAAIEGRIAARFEELRAGAGTAARARALEELRHSLNATKYLKNLLAELSERRSGE